MSPSVSCHTTIIICFLYYIINYACINNNNIKSIIYDYIVKMMRA